MDINLNEEIKELEKLVDGNITHYVCCHKEYDYSGIEFDKDRWVFVSNNKDVNFDKTGCKTLYPKDIPNRFNVLGNSLSEFYGLYYILGLKHETEFISFNHYRRIISPSAVQFCFDREWFSENKMITFGHYNHTVMSGLKWWFKDEIEEWVNQLFDLLGIDYSLKESPMYSHHALFVIRSCDALKLRNFIYGVIDNFLIYYNIKTKEDVIEASISKGRNERLIGYIGEWAIQIYELTHNKNHLKNKFIDI